MYVYFVLCGFDYETVVTAQNLLHSMLVWYGMLCNVMQCYVMLCYVMLCYVMLCHVMF